MTRSIREAAALPPDTLCDGLGNGEVYWDNGDQVNLASSCP